MSCCWQSTRNCRDREPWFSASFTHFALENLATQARRDSAHDWCSTVTSKFHTKIVCALLLHPQTTYHEPHELGRRKLWQRRHMPPKQHVRIPMSRPDVSKRTRVLHMWHNSLVGDIKGLLAYSLLLIIFHHYIGLTKKLDTCTRGRFSRFFKTP